MIDPELAALADLHAGRSTCPTPWRRVQAFEAMLAALRIDIPGSRRSTSRTGWFRVGRATPTWPCGSTGPRTAPGSVCPDAHDPRWRLHPRQRRGRARRRGPDGARRAQSSSRSSTAWPPSTRSRPACTTATPRSRSYAEAGALGVDPARVALLGTSAGGGLAAATALLARDRGGPAGVLPDAAHPRARRSAGDALHAGLRRLAGVEPAPGRAELGGLPGRLSGPQTCRPTPRRHGPADLSGLPPAYVSTAENDPLRDEGILYGLRLLQAGVSVELHQFPGTFHGSTLVTTAAVSRRARARRQRCCGPAGGGRGGQRVRLGAGGSPRRESRHTPTPRSSAYSRMYSAATVFIPQKARSA